jgi:hypothetical protein
MHNILLHLYRDRILKQGGVKRSVTLRLYLQPTGLLSPRDQGMTVLENSGLSRFPANPFICLSFKQTVQPVP